MLTMVKSTHPPAGKARLPVKLGSRTVSDADHYWRHRQPGKCARCYWGKHGFKLAQKFLLKDALPCELQAHAKFNLDDTWVVVDRRPKALKDSTEIEYVFKCSVCLDFVAKCRTVQKGSLTTHHRSKSHRLKLMEKCQVAFGPTGIPIGGAPTVEEFRKAWIAAGKGDLISKRDQ